MSIAPLASYNSERMASGKASRRRRAAQQRAAVVVQRRRRNTVRRHWVLVALVAAVALALGLGIGVAALGKSSDPSEGTTLSNAVDAAAVFEGIPQAGPALGRPDAPVTVVEFADVQCPYCRAFAVESLPTLVEEQIRTGKARLEIRGLSFLGPDSERGMRAALAAGQQGRLFELTELLYYNQGVENAGWLSQGLVEAAARSFPGIDVARLVDDMDSGIVSDTLHHHAEEAQERGVIGTPTFFVGPTGGELRKVEIADPTDIAPIQRAIARAAR